jgi:hypothetical protein
MPAVAEEPVFAPVAFTQEAFAQAVPIGEPPIEARIVEPMCVVAWAPPPLVQPRSVQQPTARGVDITHIRPATKAAR